MKEDNKELDQYRVKTGIMVSPNGVNYGAFNIKYKSYEIFVVSSGSDNGTDWEHVSVSMKNRMPHWEVMTFIKDLFWRIDETVIQFHPKKTEYVNDHENVLHLWKHKSGHDLPPKFFV